MSGDALLYWDTPEGGVERLHLGLHPLTFGSSELCAVQLPDEARVARVHGLVERYRGTSRMRRLSWVQPCVVDGAEVDDRTLEHGDRIACGGSEVIHLEGRAIAPTSLRLHLGVDDGEEETVAETPLTQTIVGRSAGDLRVDDESISREHLALEHFGHGLLWARDLDSTNGSELNGEPLTQRRPIREGDVLKAGRVTIRIELGDEVSEGMETPSPSRVAFG